MVGVKAGPTFTQALFGPAYAMPMNENLHLEAGRWVIYEKFGTQRVAGPLTVTETDDSILVGTQIRIHDPAGEFISPEFVTTNQTINRNGDIYTGATSFQARVSGTYSIQLEGDATAVIISPDPLNALRSSVGWLLLTGLGALGCIASTIWFFTGIGGERTFQPISGRARQARIGWYSDPSTPGQLRRWNGEEWGATKPSHDN